MKVCDLKRGMVVVADQGGTHLGVVVHEHSAAPIVAFGTSQSWFNDDARVEVKRRCRAAFVLGLTKDTYFYPKDVAYVKDGTTIHEVKKHRCPVNVFHELEAMVNVAAVRDGAVELPDAAAANSTDEVTVSGPVPLAVSPAAASTGHDD